MSFFVTISDTAIGGLSGGSAGEDLTSAVAKSFTHLSDTLAKLEPPIIANALKKISSTIGALSVSHVTQSAKAPDAISSDINKPGYRSVT